LISGNGKTLYQGEIDFLYQTGLDLSLSDWSYRGWNFPTFVLVSDAFRTWSYIEKGIINGTVGINELRDAVRKQ